MTRDLQLPKTVALARTAPPPSYHGGMCTCEAGGSVIPKNHEPDCGWRTLWESEQDERAKEERHGR